MTVCEKLGCVLLCW